MITSQTPFRLRSLICLYLYFAQVFIHEISNPSELMEVIEGEAKMEIEETYSSSWLMALPYSTDDYTLLLNDIVSVAREIIRSNGPNVLLGALLIKNLRR